MRRACTLERYRQLRTGACLLWVAEPLAEAALALGLLEPGGLARLLAQGGGAPGRTDTAVAQLPGHRERLHLRPVRHGGWLGGLRGERLLALRRPLAELAVGERLWAAGAPVSTPALVAAQRAGPAARGWRAAVGTIHREASLDGIRFLAARPDPERRRRAVDATARALRLFHAAGGRHGDLHLGNVLISEGPETCEAILVDLDGARALPRTTPRARAADLMRLYRSLKKRGFDDAIDAGERRRFLRIYADGDGELERALRVHIPGELARIALHRLAWRRRTVC